MSAPARVEPPLCRCDRWQQRCMLCGFRVRVADRSGCLALPRRARGDCPILVFVNRLQKEHPA